MPHHAHRAGFGRKVQEAPQFKRPVLEHLIRNCFIYWVLLSCNLGLHALCWNASNTVAAFVICANDDSWCTQKETIAPVRPYSSKN